METPSNFVLLFSNILGLIVLFALFFDWESAVNHYKDRNNFRKRINSHIIDGKPILIQKNIMEKNLRGEPCPIYNRFSVGNILVEETRCKSGLIKQRYVNYMGKPETWKYTTRGICAFVYVRPSKSYTFSDFYANMKNAKVVSMV